MLRTVQANEAAQLQPEHRRTRALTPYSSWHTYDGRVQKQALTPCRVEPACANTAKHILCPDKLPGIAHRYAQLAEASVMRSTQCSHRPHTW